MVLSWSGQSVFVNLRRLSFHYFKTRCKSRTHFYGLGEGLRIKRKTLSGLVGGLSGNGFPGEFHE